MNPYLWGLAHFYQKRRFHHEKVGIHIEWPNFNHQILFKMEMFNYEWQTRPTRHLGSKNHYPRRVNSTHRRVNSTTRRVKSTPRSRRQYPLGRNSSSEVEASAPFSLRSRFAALRRASASTSSEEFRPRAAPLELGVDFTCLVVEFTRRWVEFTRRG